MASFNIHLAIAKKSAIKNNINNLKDFFNGSIAPDLVEDTEKSHYSGSRNKNDIIDYLSNKVLLYNLALDNTIENDYKKGEFLHLITDYLFYNVFFEREYLLNTTYEGFVRDLYYSYDLTNKYLETNYELDSKYFESAINTSVNHTLKMKNMEKDFEATNILGLEKLDNFIDYVSEIDIDQYRTLILEHGSNIIIPRELNCP